jgi:hypothetical protein
VGICSANVIEQQELFHRGEPVTGLTDYIGQFPIYRTDATRRLYELEDELAAALHRVAEEMKSLMSKDFAENELQAFCTGEAIYGLLDRFASSSIPAARALLRRFSYKVSESSEESDSMLNT